MTAYRAVEHECSFDLTAAPDEARLRRVLAPLAAEPEGEVVPYALRPDGDALALLRREDVLYRVEDPRMLPLVLVDALNRRAAHSVRHLTAHAAAWAGPRGVVALLGGAGAGKTTLVATLCLDHGGAYVTDETLAVSLAGGRVTPYRKPLTVKRGRAAHLDPLLGGLPEEVDGSVLVPPDRLGAHSAAPGLPLAAVVVLAREEGREATLDPLARSEALLQLFAVSGSLSLLGPVALDAAERATRGVATYRLRYDDARAAAALVAGV